MLSVRQRLPDIFSTSRVSCCMPVCEVSIRALSSARSKSFIHFNLHSKFVSDFFITQSITIANSNGDKMHPWRTPVTTSNQSPVTPFCLIQLLLSLYRLRIMFTMLSGIPYCLKLTTIRVDVCSQRLVYEKLKLLSL